MRHINIHNISDCLLIFIFLCLIGAPLFVQMVEIDIKTVTDENRGLASFPTFQRGKDKLIEYPERFEKYHNDNFGLRDILIHANNIITVKWFHVSSTNRVVIGKEGWLFSGGRYAVDSYTSRWRLSEAQLKKYGQIFQAIHQWLKDRNIKFIMMIIPDKQEIYGEYMPDNIHRGPYPTA